MGNKQEKTVGRKCLIFLCDVSYTNTMVCDFHADLTTDAIQDCTPAVQMLQGPWKVGSSTHGQGSGVCG